MKFGKAHADAYAIRQQICTRRMSVNNRLEVTGVKLLIEKRDSIVGQPIQPTGDFLDKAVFGQGRKSVISVAVAGNPKVVNRSWGEVAFVSHQLKDALVDGAHPVSPLPHNWGVGCAHHNRTGYESYGADGYIFAGHCVGIGAKGAPTLI